MVGLPSLLFIRGELGVPCWASFAKLEGLFCELSGRYVLDIILWDIPDRNAPSVGDDTERGEIEVEVVESVLLR